MVRDLLVIAGQQRSGTTVLGSLLGKTARIHSFHEVFHPGGVKSASNFQAFLSGELAHGRASIAPDAADRFALFDRYLAHLKSLTEKPAVLIDVKYNSWHHFNESWQGLLGAPLLVPIVKKRGAGVLHVIRRDALAQALSQELAKDTGVWHSPGVKAPPTSYRRFSPQSIVDVVRGSIIQKEQFRYLFRGYAAYSEIFYEELLTNNCLSKQAIVKISALSGSTVEDPGKADYHKVSPPLEDFVENLEEIKIHLRSSGLGHVVDTHDQIQGAER